MKVLAAILLIFFIMMICLLFMKIKVTLTLKIDEKLQQAEMIAEMLFGLVLVRRRVDLESVLTGAGSRKDPAVPAGKTDWKRYAGAGPEIRRALGKVKVRSLIWESVVGLGDAAETAAAYGWIWTTKAGIISFAERWMPILEKKLFVEPDFHRMLLKTRLECMMDIRVGNAILEAFRLYRKMKKPARSAADGRSNIDGGASY